MTHTKLFLGVTTGLLALAGVAAEINYGPALTRYYITLNGRYCQCPTGVCTAFGSVQCYYTVGTLPNLHRLPLFTKGPCGLKTATNCTHPVLYNTEH